jgi:hypothetical protein
MWVIVAVTLGFSGEPKLAIVPGREYPTETACVQATRVRGNFDSKRAEKSSLAFSFCMPKESVQIGAASEAPSGDAQSDTKSE